MQFRTYKHKKFAEIVSRKDFEKVTQKIDLREILAHPDQDLEKLEKVRTLITRHGSYHVDRLYSELRAVIKVAFDAQDAEFLDETCAGYQLTFNGNDLCGGNLLMFYRIVPDKAQDYNLERSWGEPAWFYPKLSSQEAIAQCCDTVNDPTCKDTSSKVQKYLKSIGKPVCQADINESFHKIVECLPEKSLRGPTEELRQSHRFSESYACTSVPSWFKPVIGNAFRTEEDLDSALAAINGGHRLSKDDYLRRAGGFLSNRREVDAKLVEAASAVLSHFMRAKLYYAVLAELGLVIAAKRKVIRENPELLAAENTKKAMAKTDAILAVLEDIQKTKKTIDAIIRAIEIDSMTEETLRDFGWQVRTLDSNAKTHIAKLRKHYITPFKKR